MGEGFVPVVSNWLGLLDLTMFVVDYDYITWSWNTSLLTLAKWIDCTLSLMFPIFYFSLASAVRSPPLLYDKFEVTGSGSVFHRVVSHAR